MSVCSSPTRRYSGRQDTYLARIQTIAQAVCDGNMEVPCPRDACEHMVQASQDGTFLVLSCPSCGVIFRGNCQRLLAGIF